MKRILTGLALAAAATLVATPPAQAAPVDPVKALKKQFVAGHGVRISETSVIKADGKNAGTMKTTGTFAFGKKGVAASDLRNRTTDDAAAGLTPSRVITIGGHSYAQGGVFSEDLPEGKKWVRYPGEATGTTFNQMLDVLNPKMLKVFVAKAKSFKGGTYRGAITFSELSKLNGTKMGGSLGKIKFNYRITVNSKGLVNRLVSDWTMDFGILGKFTSITDTRYTGWGSKVTVKAPPADQVITPEEAGPDSGIPQDIPDNSISSLGKVN
ncbi:hypothetical protein HII36_39830 [Nonomuraea sp. NN258]|uniref:hypothetical protein n=1 Tax=Nonomuraea antri TaxID=2730852 RepID=UPI00156A5E2E|nr:hypothetical protein [Nonomuraea antri]NRQ37938.1 hypothetical protein [Nonomuraea antri]